MLNININHPKIFMLSLIYTLLIIGRIVGFMPSIPTYIVAVTSVIITLIFILPSFNKIYKPIVFFFIYIAIALVLLSPPSIFHTWQRLILFISVMCTAFPVISNIKFYIFRKYCFNIAIIVGIILSCITFICYFLGINYMTYEANLEFTEKGGLFAGLFKHSIIMGTISGASVCALLYYSITKSWKYIFIMIPCFSSLMFSASRGAIYATIAGCVALLLLMIREQTYKKKVISYSITCIALLFIILTQTNLMFGIEDKAENRYESNILSSRENKIGYRVEEFKSSPIIGIGFSSIDEYGGDGYDRETGVVEPGSSWFAVLSMTGIIGLLFVTKIIYDSYINIISANRGNKYLHVSIMIFFIMASFSEGYIFAGGSTLCFLFWLTIGQCIELKYYK